MESLPVKYRPREFKDVCSQDSIIKILERQIETKNFKNTYLFAGPSGCGKTTIARILANKINQGCGEPIEIDAASNNGVDSVRQIIESADQRALDSEYKIYLVDECHMLTTQAWNALLKTIEETPKYTIFMFCTTDYHKVPVTIQNRCQQYFLTRVPQKEIENRLYYICEQEGLKAHPDGINHIAKLSLGSMRQAIAYLEKCRDYSESITIDNVLTVLGDFSYDTYFSLVNSIIDKKSSDVINIIEDLYNKGNDLKLFLDMFIEFVLDLDKFTIFKSFDIIKIPQSYKEKVEYTVNVENATKYYNHLIDKLLNVKVMLKGDSDMKTSMEIALLGI